MPRDALDMLAAAATRELQTDREQRKLDACLRRFKDMETKTPKKAKPAKSDEAMQLLGTIVWKKFLVKQKRGKPTPKWYQGEVVSVSFVNKRKSMYEILPGVTSSVKYLVEYTDGDTEDMTPQQVLAHKVG
jgi:hypothetical protein